MWGSALLALLGLCLGLPAASEEATATKDFDSSKVGVGPGLSSALPCGCLRRAPKVERMRGVPLQLEDGPLALTATYYEGRCMVEKSIAPKKVVPGTATITREGGEGSREAQALSTDYETYTIMDILSTAGGASHRVRKLYSGRSLDHKQSALQKFREVAQEHGFQEPDFHLGQHDSEWLSPQGQACLALPCTWPLCFVLSGLCGGAAGESPIPESRVHGCPGEGALSALSFPTDRKELS
ncbi:epididymal-specific lipocalin-5-like [Heterocephalus glaber]|uniref:Epididymal-specific lipocalin-5-like n=1 Tax=Heterocephalus glaber TaxID=10181 RepID=A0AAX6T9T7_HETGA|nr:epididymal-specific lipocalin-5-like [Heterocephalus glaber]